MSDYVIIRHKGLYKIYIRVMNQDDVYQYAGASFTMLADAQAFVQMRNDEQNAS